MPPRVEEGGAVGGEGSVDEPRGQRVRVACLTRGVAAGLAVVGAGLALLAARGPRADGEDVAAGGGPEIVAQMVLGPGGERLLLVGADGSLTRWERIEGDGWRAVARVRSGYVAAAAYAPDGRTVALADTGPVVRLCDATTLEETGRLTSTGPGARALAFSPDGGTLAGANIDGTVSLWEVASGRERLRFPAHPRITYQVSFAPDGRSLFSSGWDGAIRRWDVATGDGRAALGGVGGPIVAFVLTSDGATLASAGLGEPFVRLWEVGSGRERGRLPSGGEGAQALAVAPDGRRWVVAGTNGTVTLWDRLGASGREVCRGRFGSIRRLGFGPDGGALILGLSGRRVHSLDLAAPAGG